jgi:PIN domain nuclease of toxin-antitoxin system
MIVLESHIWVWWAHGEARLTTTQAAIIAEHEAGIIRADSAVAE